MKQGIHPTYHTDSKVTCACGNIFTTGSTLSEVEVEICSACHPFFTGEMRFVDVQGRVEKFQAKMKVASKYRSSAKGRSASGGNKRKGNLVTDKPKQTKSLKEMLQSSN